MSCDPRSLPEYLPQCGYSTETEFKRLVERNAFLFRVHTPKSPTPSDALFPALKFDQRFTSGTVSPSLDPPPPSYTDVVRHMDWTTRHSSPYVSASFSFMWAIWEAVRRYHFGVKHDVEIAVIDATAIPTRSITAVEILRSVSSSQRHENHWKWYHFAQESQLVLVYGGTPQTAVLTSIPLLRIIDKLPSYCLRPLSPAPLQTPIERLSQSFLLQKPSFRNFCIAQSAAFLRASPNTRFLDSTSAAVRLALAFLGVWFHWMLRLHPPRENDPTVFSEAAVAKVTELARAIAAWPAAGETNKMWDTVIREIALLVAEEVKAHRRGTDSDAKDNSHDAAPIPMVKSPIPTNLDATKKIECPDLDRSTSIPIFLDPRNFLPTPPPTPPPTLIARHAVSTETSLRVPELPPHEEDSDSDMEVDVRMDTAGKTFTIPAEATLVPQRSTSPVPEPPSVDNSTLVDDDAVTPPQVISAPATSTTKEQYRGPQLHSKSETASCLLTGFLFGVLIIFALSQQRRPVLLYVS